MPHVLNIISTEIIIRPCNWICGWMGIYANTGPGGGVEALALVALEAPGGGGHTTLWHTHLGTSRCVALPRVAQAYAEQTTSPFTAL